MPKIILQTISQVEFDTDTGKSRLIKAFSTLLGEGNRPKKVVKEAKVIEAEVGEVEYL
jgi:hypothetical protein